MPDISANEVWFVTGSQHLYGPETLATVAGCSPAAPATPASRRTFPPSPTPEG